MIEPGEPFVSEYTLDADPFGPEPGLFTVKVLRRTEHLWSVTRFGENYWWNGTEWDHPPYDGMDVSIKEWHATHRWQLDEALEQAKTAIRTIRINSMNYDDHLDWVQKRDGGMDFETWKNQRKDK